MRAATQLHREIISVVMHDAQYGNATHIRTIYAKLNDTYANATIKFAIKGLCDGRVIASGCGLQHVGGGYYELTAE